MNIIISVAVMGSAKIVINKSNKETDNVSDTFTVKDRDSLRTRLQAFVNTFTVKANNLKDKQKIDDAFFTMIERAVNDNSEKIDVMARDSLYFYRIFER